MQRDIRANDFDYFVSADPRSLDSSHLLFNFPNKSSVKMHDILLNFVPALSFWLGYFCICHQRIGIWAWCISGVVRIETGALYNKLNMIVIAFYLRRQKWLAYGELAILFILSVSLPRFGIEKCTISKIQLSSGKSDTKVSESSRGHRHISDTRICIFIESRETKY